MAPSAAATAASARATSCASAGANEMALMDRDDTLRFVRSFVACAALVAAAGRDLDLIYYAVDERSRPVAPADSMPRYPFFDLRAREPGPQEHGILFGPFSTRFFDVRRNWALVRALLEDPGIEIQYLFIHARL